ncbi:hypothetical protein SAMN04488516_102201 [Desulfonauticus submarinus]|uniref:Uncharacterized protein n=1 Tax=Desulfonauticus submarinus TaxID=206665 RepID=A0A1H0BK40_9BACT|nr:YeeE/YedE thiosulfate transporter family protein [Desulfonauticus submarinus]SDN46026.1 hypothetical protein SAMN04488516_102201 [Desulfonauticus submarinus]
MYRKKNYWSPYIAGALSGVLLVVSVWLVGKFFGASTSFVRIAGLIEKSFAPSHVASLAYFQAKTPKIEWQVMFVFGIFLGSLIASLSSKTFKISFVPTMWENKFGFNPLKRGIVAFLGGIIAMIGVRMAGGCPSGHGLSGVAQLSAGSILALCCFFIGGLISANLIYKRR